MVTGGAGFVGSQVVDELVAAGWQVRVVDRLHPRAHDGVPHYLNPEAEYIWADVRDADALDRALAGVDAVSHQASMVGLGVDLADAGEYVGDNCLGTAVLVETLHRRRFRGRVVLAGSMVVYGEGRYRCPVHGLVAPGPREPEQLARGEFEPPCPDCGAALAPEPVPESAPPDPRNVYAATKLHQEHLLWAFAREAQTPAISLRYHNVYGPRMPRDTLYAGVAGIFRSALAAGEAPAVFEDGRQLRDFVAASDVAAANRLALEAPSGLGGAFNVASGRPRSVGELATAMAQAMEGPTPRITGEFRLGDVRHVFASADRARNELGFEARVDFEAGVRELAERDSGRAPFVTGVGVRV
jgi:dTDP-L-rhamnose 4-epimerase